MRSDRCPCLRSGRDRGQPQNEDDPEPPISLPRTPDPPGPRVYLGLACLTPALWAMAYVMAKPATQCQARGGRLRIPGTLMPICQRKERVRP